MSNGALLIIKREWAKRDGWPNRETPSIVHHDPQRGSPAVGQIEFLTNQTAMQLLHAVSRIRGFSVSLVLSIYSFNLEIRTYKYRTRSDDLLRVQMIYREICHRYHSSSLSDYLNKLGRVLGLRSNHWLPSIELCRPENAIFTLRDSSASPKTGWNDT